MNKFKIINYCTSLTGLSTKTIKSYLNVLPEIYKSCEVPLIFVPNNYFGYLMWKYHCYKLDLRIIDKKSFDSYGGSCYYCTEKCEAVAIFVKHSSERNLCTPFVLFHELRHWYQEKYLKGFNDKHMVSYNSDTSINDYREQPIEKDADNFAKKYCKKLGIKFMKEKGQLIICN